MSVRCVAAVVMAVVVSGSGHALAATCPGNPGAIGTSRVIAVDPAEHARIGSIQYRESLPLAPKEVVFTFDDGPLPAYTERILDTLAAECVKATFFMVGNMARAYPQWVRRVHNAGHTIATHTNSHPSGFRHLSYERSVSEIETGITAVTAALGDPRALAPFFRFPGLNRTREVEGYLIDRGVMTWSADIPSDDWRGISADKVIQRTLRYLERKGRGVVLMHDIQPVTALALPELLQELKRRRYRIVHVVPAGPGRPKTVTEPGLWVYKGGGAGDGAREWPIVLRTTPLPRPDFPVPSTLSFGFPHPLAPILTIGSFDGERPAMTVRGFGFAMLPGRDAETKWPAQAAVQSSVMVPELRSVAAEEIAPVAPPPAIPTFEMPLPAADADTSPPAASNTRADAASPASTTEGARPSAPAHEELGLLDVPSARRILAAETAGRPPRTGRPGSTTTGERTSREEGEEESWSRRLNWSYTP